MTTKIWPPLRRIGYWSLDGTDIAHVMYTVSYRSCMPTNPHSANNPSSSRLPQLQVHYNTSCHSHLALSCAQGGFPQLIFRFPRIIYVSDTVPMLFERAHIGVGDHARSIRQINTSQRFRTLRAGKGFNWSYHGDSTGDLFCKYKIRRMCK